MNEFITTPLSTSISHKNVRTTCVAAWSGVPQGVLLGPEAGSVTRSYSISWRIGHYPEHRLLIFGLHMSQELFRLVCC